MPDRVVTIGAVGGAVGVLLVWLLGFIWGIIIPAEPAMALQTVVIFAVQYLVPHSLPVTIDKNQDGIPDEEI